ncbi:glycosyltransferase family 10 (fucosyltransferase) c-term domain-containing protein [Phthorimaea operculella]|nr:glycosyltransferase family 10 (fucosyltransferase) c-term domain-containing protein [Phthorimaea operculella]
MIPFPKLSQRQLIFMFTVISLFTFMNICFVDVMPDYVRGIRRKMSVMNDAHNKTVVDPVKLDPGPVLSTAGLVVPSVPSDPPLHILFWNINKDLSDHDQYIQCNSNCEFHHDYGNSDSANRSTAILFSPRTLNLSDMPTERRDNQFYIFLCLKHSSSAPFCIVFNDRFFNLTITYRLSSTIPWNYVSVQDLSTGDFVAPNKSVIWKKSNPNQSDPITPQLNATISRKFRPLAWISSGDIRGMMDEHWKLYMNDLEWHLIQFGMDIDIYGPFSKIRCPNDDCDKLIKTDYYFYIALEDFVTEDYVSSEVLRAYNNFAVPIVYGGANYSWFLPPGSYLNARELEPRSLAKKIGLAVSNPDVYAEYFKWRHLYRITSNEEHHPFCQLCEMLNKIVKK